MLELINNLLTYLHMPAPRPLDKMANLSDAQENPVYIGHKLGNNPQADLI